MSGINLNLITEMFNSIELGIILINENDEICTWNNFMTRHSRKQLSHVTGRNLFEIFPGLPKIWLTMKLRGVRQLQNISKVSWEQRPVLFDFPHGGTMLQNCTFIPIRDPVTEEKFLCITIQDVSDSAKDKIELKELIQINKSLEEISNFDALTGIFNRRYICSVLQEKVNETRGTDNQLVLLMFDLDHFKSVNDTYGHIAGDRVLQYVSETISSGLLENCEFGRYGGEEFLVYFSGYSIEDVLRWTENIRIKLSEGQVDSREDSIKITASFGIAQFNPDIKDDLELIHNADVALYRSKKEGRNRVSLFSSRE